MGAVLSAAEESESVRANRRRKVATCAHANEKASLTDARTEEADGQSETAKYSIEDAEPTKDVINRFR